MLRRLALAAAALAAAGATGFAGTGVETPQPAVAATPNRAALVVDNGTEVKTACVEFAESSITGLEALQRAGFAPAAWGFGNLGAAVCGMCGRGCPADASCLTCDSPNYWAYHRAAAGRSSFTFSPQGPSSTRVVDGAVEGWRYGTGAAPAFRTFVSVCGQAASPSTAPPATPTTSAGGTGAAGTTGGGPASGGNGGPGTGQATATDAGATAAPTDAIAPDPAAETGPEQQAGSDAASTAEDGDLATQELSTTGAAPEGSGSGAWGWALLALVVAVIAGILGVQRVRRAGPASHDV